MIIIIIIVIIKEVKRWKTEGGTYNEENVSLFEEWTKATDERDEEDDWCGWHDEITWRAYKLCTHRPRDELHLLNDQVDSNRNHDTTQHLYMSIDTNLSQLPDGHYDVQGGTQKCRWNWPSFIR